MSKIISRETKKNEPTDKIIRKNLFCVPLLFRNFGYLINNQRYTHEDFVNLVRELKLNLVLKDSFTSYSYSSEFSTSFVLQVNDSHTHAFALTMADYVSENDMFVDNLNVGAKKRVRVIPQMKTQRKAVREPKNFQRKKQVKVDEKLNKIEQKVDNIQKEEKKEIKTLVKKRIKKPFSANREYHVEAAMKSRKLSMRTMNFVRQVFDPYKVSQGFPFADGQSVDVSMHKAWQQIVLQPTLFGNTSWLSLIHTGNLNCMYLKAVKDPRTQSSYILADLRTYTDVDGAILLDKVPSAIAQDRLGAGVSRSYFRDKTAADLIIPMRSGVDVSEAGDVTMRGFSELVDSAGNPSLINTVSYFSSAENTYIPFIKATNSDLVIVTVSGTNTTTAAVTMNLVLTGGVGTTSATAVVATQIVPAGGPFTIAFTFSAFNWVATGGNIDKIAALTLSCSCVDPMFLSLDSIKVQMNTGNNSWPTSYAFLPFGCFSGSPVPSFQSLENIVKSYRNIASSLLFSNYTNMLSIQGSVMGVQVKTGFTPAESGIQGDVSINTSYQTENYAAKKGLYSAPMVLANEECAAFRQISSGWSGTQPYTLLIAKFPALDSSGNPIQYAFRATFCNIFELRTETNQQTLPRLTIARNDELIKELDHINKQVTVLCENPLHLGFLSDLFHKVQSGIKTVSPYIESGLNLANRFANLEI